MDVWIIEHIKEKLQVAINCRQIDDEIMRLKYHIEMFDKKLQAKKDKEQLSLIIRCTSSQLMVELENQPIVPSKKMLIMYDKTRR